jgi:hypothetical protein
MRSTNLRAVCWAADGADTFESLLMYASSALVRGKKKASTRKKVEAISQKSDEGFCLSH